MLIQFSCKYSPTQESSNQFFTHLKDLSTGGSIERLTNSIGGGVRIEGVTLLYLPHEQVI